MTKLVLGWSLVLLGAVAGCTTTVQGGSEAGGGIQDAEENVLVPPGTSTSTGTPPVQASSTSTGGVGGATGDGGAPPTTEWGDLPGPPDLGGNHRPPTCDAGVHIVLLTVDHDILAFDPVTESTSLQSTAQCAHIDSVTMADTGALLATTEDDELVSIDPMTGACAVLTDIDPAQGLEKFAIGFVASGSGPGGQIIANSFLFFDDATPLVAEVDPGTGAMSVIGPVHPDLEQMHLTTGVDGRIGGFAFPPNQPVLAFELDVATADVLWTLEIPPPTVFGTRMASARWGDSVYVFWGNERDDTTVMSRLDLATGVSTPWSPLEGGAVFAAGTPTCATPR